jgi:hypothetical protein
MRTAALLLLLAGMGCHEAMAADPPAVGLQPISQYEVTGSNQTLFYFSGQPMRFRVNASAPLGSHITVIGDLFQTTAGGWTAMVFKGRPISPALTFDTRTNLDMSCSLPSLPPVRSRTRFLLKLGLRLTNRPDSVIPAGTVEIFVYPRPSDSESKAAFTSLLARHAIRRVVIFGDGAGLRDYFRRCNIKFDDIGAAWPQDIDSTTLYLGDSPPSLPSADPIPAIHEVLFVQPTDDPAALPGAYSVTNGSGGTTVKVNLPGFIDRLGDDPRCQQTFMTLITQAVAGPYPVAASSPHTSSQFQ